MGNHVLLPIEIHRKRVQWDAWIPVTVLGKNRLLNRTCWAPVREDVYKDELSGGLQLREPGVRERLLRVRRRSLRSDSVGTQS